LCIVSAGGVETVMINASVPTQTRSSWAEDCFTAHSSCWYNTYSHLSHFLLWYFGSRYTSDNTLSCTCLLLLFRGADVYNTDWRHRHSFSGSRPHWYKQPDC